MTQPIARESFLPLMAFLIPIVFGALSLLLRKSYPRLHAWLALTGLGLTAIVSFRIFALVTHGWTLTMWGGNLYVDGLSALMLVLSGVIGFLVVIYSMPFIPTRLLDVRNSSRRLSTYYGQLLIFLGMMNWTCSTNNIVMLYLSLELTTLATAFLVIFYQKKASIEAGYKYLMLVTVGILCALMGIALIYAAAAGLPKTQTMGLNLLLISDLAKTASKMAPSLVLLANAFLIAGFGTKAGLVPFHAWLPDAHAEAPEPVSALLSGIVIKVGAYALARTITIFSPGYNAIVIFVAIIASASMLFGILMALVQDDLKRMLAYSSVSQIGYIVEGLGLGTYLGIYGGLFHLINHTLFKALLFLSVGAIVYTAGTRKISELGGLGRRAPKTAACFFVGALAIGGLPPFGAFMSKLTLFIAAADRGLMWAAVIAVFTGLLTVACFVRAAYRIFWGELAPNREIVLDGVGEVPKRMWGAMAVIAVLVLFLGVYPRAAYPLLDSATRCILNVLGGPAWAGR